MYTKTIINVSNLRERERERGAKSENYDRLLLFGRVKLIYAVVAQKFNFYEEFRFLTFKVLIFVLENSIPDLQIVNDFIWSMAQNSKSYNILNHSCE